MKKEVKESTLRKHRELTVKFDMRDMLIHDPLAFSRYDYLLNDIKDKGGEVIKKSGKENIVRIKNIDELNEDTKQFLADTLSEGMTEILDKRIRRDRKKVKKVS